LIHFGDAEVARALHGVDLVAALRQAFVDLSERNAEQQARARIEAGDIKLSTLGAVVPRQGVAGAKVYTTISGRFSFLIALFSAHTGKALATFDAGEITRLRTAAVSVLAAQHGARERISEIVVFGTGKQGRAHEKALAEAYPHAHVRAIGRNDSDRSIVEEAQIVVTATRSPSPLFAGRRVSPGAFVCAVGSSRPDTRELDDVLIGRARTVIVEWKQQTLCEAGDLLMLAPEARARLSIVELGDVVAGRVRPRESERDIVIFKSVGVGIEDVVVAGLAYRRLTGVAP
jgi:ornithine cyclodeaminase